MKHSHRQIIEWIVLVLEIAFISAGLITGREEYRNIGLLFFGFYYVLMSFRLIDESSELAEENFMQSMKCIRVEYLLENTRMRLDEMSREEVKEMLNAAIKMLDK